MLRLVLRTRLGAQWTELVRVGEPCPACLRPSDQPERDGRAFESALRQTTRDYLVLQEPDGVFLQLLLHRARPVFR